MTKKGSGTRKNPASSEKTRQSDRQSSRSAPVPKPRSAPVSQEPTISCEEFVNAHGRSPALKRYLLRHYGSASKTTTAWQKIVDGLRTREVS